MTKAAIRLNDDLAPAANDDEAGFGALRTERGCLPLVAMEVEARIAGVLAETLVRQTFRNALDEPLEATYIFPLPDRAAVSKFELRVGGRTIVGDLKERGQAREDYDRAIEHGHRAAIAEEERSGVFTLRVGNLPPRETATIELTLAGPLPVADGEATFRFPLVVAPRYTPGVPLDGPSVGDGTALDTDEVPDASRVTPPVLLSGFPNPVQLSLSVQLEPASAVVDAVAWVNQIRSSLHSTINDGTWPVVVRLQPGERLNRDFILRFPVVGKQLATSLDVAPAKNEVAGIFALTLLPPKFASSSPRHPRDVVFVLDRSGSMRGWKMVAARRALGRILDTLDDQDRFTVLAFDTVVERPPQAAGGLVAGTNRERWRVLEWLGKVDARDGTEMQPALHEAVKYFHDATRQGIMVIVTDGQVTGEDILLRELTKHAGQRMPRIFTVGIDQAVNAGFLQRLADVGHGACELVESEEHLDAAMDRIHRLIGTPVLTDVRLEPLNFDWVEKSLAPQCIGNLFSDRPVTIFGRHLLSDANMRLRIHGTDQDGKLWSAEVDGRPATGSMLLNLWGRAKVRDLEDQFAAGQARDVQKLADEIIAVSLASHVLSRFTAYVAIDTTEMVNAGGQQTTIVQPVELPAGWDDSTQTMLCMAAPAYARGAMPMGFSPWVTETRVDALPLCRKSLGPTAKDNFLLGYGDSLCMGSDADSIVPRRDQLTSLGSMPPELFGKWIDFVLRSAVQSRATEIRIATQVDTIALSFLVHGNWVEVEPPFATMMKPILEALERMAGFSAVARDQQRQAVVVQQVQGHTWQLEILSSAGACGPEFTIRISSVALAPPAPKNETKPAKRKRFWW